MSKLAKYYQSSGIVYFSVTLVLFLAVPCLLALLLSFFTDWPFNRALDVASNGISVSLLLAGIGWMLVSRLRAGPVFLDIKAIHPSYKWFIFGLIGYLFFLSLDFDFRNVWLSLKSQTVSLLLVGYFLILAFGRLQVRKRGIWLYAALITWHSIKSYTLQNGVLYLQTTGLRLWTREGYVIPEEHVEAFERHFSSTVFQKAPRSRLLPLKPLSGFG